MALFAEPEGDVKETVFIILLFSLNWCILGTVSNTISNFKSGIGIGGRLHHADFYNNKLNSDVADSFGYYSRGGDFNDILIKNENIEVTRRPIDFYNIKADSNAPLVFDECDMVSTGRVAYYIYNCENIIIQNSTLNMPITIIKSLGIQLLNNK